MASFARAPGNVNADSCEEFAANTVNDTETVRLKYLDSVEPVPIWIAAGLIVVPRIPVLLNKWNPPLPEFSAAS